MALSASTVWEVRTDGSDTNGGGFVTGSGGTDYSQQASAQLSVSDAACSGTTTVTSATGGFTSAMVGNLMYLSSGPGWYQITAYTDTNTVTIDRNGPNASGMTANVGGAFATPGCLSDKMVSGNFAWVKSGTYTITTSTPGPSGPFYQSVNSVIFVEGYQTTRGDEGTAPELNAGAIASVALWRMNCTNQPSHFRNLSANGNNNASITGFSYNGFQNGLPFKCVAKNCSNGFNSCGGMQCYAESCATGFTSREVQYCIAKSCTTRGFVVNIANHCVADSCVIGFNNLDNATVHNGCLAYNCTDGYYQDATAATRANKLFFCIAHTCNRGFTNQSATTNRIASIYHRCAHYNCTTGSSGTAQFHDVTEFADDPLVDAAGGDFTLSSSGYTEIQDSPWYGKAWIHTIGPVRPIPAAGGGVRIPNIRGGADQ